MRRVGWAALCRLPTALFLHANRNELEAPGAVRILLFLCITKLALFDGIRERYFLFSE